MTGAEKVEMCKPATKVARLCVVRPEGIEPSTSTFGGWRSTPLSYGRVVFHGWHLTSLASSSSAMLAGIAASSPDGCTLPAGISQGDADSGCKLAAALFQDSDLSA